MKTLIMTLMSVLFSAAFAQSDLADKSTTKIITLDEAIQIGLENSHQIHSSRMNVEYTEAKLSEINTQFFPSFKVDGSYTRLSNIDPFNLTTPFGTFNISPNIVNNYSFKASVVQPVFTGFKLRAASNAAKYTSLAALENLDKDQQEVVLKIKTSYWNLFKAQNIKEVVDENVEQMKVHLKDLENLYEQGLATKNDLLKIQVQLAETQLKQIDASNAVKISTIALNNSIGLPLNTSLQISRQLPDSLSVKNNDVKNLEELLSMGFENRPELKATSLKIKAGESAVTAAKANWYPQLYLSGNYYYSNPNQRYFPVTEQFKDAWDVSLTLSFDLWNWNRTGYQTSQAEAEYEQAKDSYKILKDAINLDITQNYLNLMQAEEKMSVSKLSVQQADENYRVASTLFKQGLLLNTELLDAEIALLQAKTNFVQTVVDFEIAKANLERAVGGSIN